MELKLFQDRRYYPCKYVIDLKCGIKRCYKLIWIRSSDSLKVVIISKDRPTYSSLGAV